MSWSVQNSTWTSNNRYPGIFRTIQGRITQKYGPSLGQAELKILSFGCSTGSEISTLRSYFPEALLYGCDVNLSALYAASEALIMDEAVLFESSPENLRKHGPFDIILAMSVLCRFPESLSSDRLSLRNLYCFADFERVADVLSDSLRVGGLLCLHNTNYSFAQLRTARDFRTVRSPLIASNGFVDKFDASGERVTWCERLGPYYVHRMRHDPKFSEGFDFVNCIFEKADCEKSDIFVPIDQGVADADAEPPQFYRFGPDLNACAGEGLVGTALGYWFEHGDCVSRVVRAWYRTRADGGIERGEKWAVRGDVASQTALFVPPSSPVSDRSVLDAHITSVGRAARHVGQRIRARLRF